MKDSNGLRAGGYTLIELGVALAILMTVLLASWSVIGGARRNERALWDELVASQLATSVLERACAEEKLNATPSEGCSVDFSSLHGTQILPELKVTLFVSGTGDQDDLCDLKAVVTWQSEPSAGEPITRRLEQTIRTRKQKE
jgi:type II secretory pathway pseudopilin PulG